MRSTLEINCSLTVNFNRYLSVFLTPLNNGELYVICCLMYLAYQYGNDFQGQIQTEVSIKKKKYISSMGRLPISGCYISYNTIFFTYYNFEFS